MSARGGASLIVATDLNRAIGVDNKLPWHLPADLKRFKELTLGHHIIMGRKTFESIGRPLPGRTSIVVTRNASYAPPAGVLTAQSLTDAMKLASADSEPFLIGGAEIYQQALEQGFVSRVYLTLVETKVARADAFFPELKPVIWKTAAESVHEPDEKNRFRFRFLTLEKS